MLPAVPVWRKWELNQQSLPVIANARRCLLLALLFGALGIGFGCRQKGDGLEVAQGDAKCRDLLEQKGIDTGQFGKLSIEQAVWRQYNNGVFRCVLRAVGCWDVGFEESIKGEMLREGAASRFITEAVPDAFSDELTYQIGYANFHGWKMVYYSPESAKDTWLVFIERW